MWPIAVCGLTVLYASRQASIFDLASFRLRNQDAFKHSCRRALRARCCAAVDGIAEQIRLGQRREPVLAAWGHSASGGNVLLHLMTCSKEE